MLSPWLTMPFVASQGDTGEADPRMKICMGMDMAIVGRERGEEGTIKLKAG
jgi:hypothetical protein